MKKNLKNNSSEKKATEKPRQYAIVKCRERVGNGSMYKSVCHNARKDWSSNLYNQHRSHTGVAATYNSSTLDTGRKSPDQTG